MLVFTQVELIILLLPCRPLLYQEQNPQQNFADILQECRMHADVLLDSVCYGLDGGIKPEMAYTCPLDRDTISMA